MIEARQKACLALFVLLCTGVLVNVLVLQPKASGTASARLQAQLDVRATSSPAPSPAAQADGTMREVADELRRLGYLPASVAPANEVAISAAVMQFQSDSRLPVTGGADAPLLAKLILQASRPTASRPAAMMLGTTTPAAEVVRTIKQALNRKGYALRSRGDNLDAETLRAIREFQMDNSLDATGAISAELLVRLQDPARRG